MTDARSREQYWEDIAEERKAVREGRDVTDQEADEAGDRYYEPREY